VFRNATNHVVDVEPAWAWVITSHLGCNSKVATLNTKILITKGELQCKKSGLCQTCEALEVTTCFGRLHIERLQRCPVCDLPKYFSYPCFCYLHFSNPTHKTKRGTANWWENPINLADISTTNCLVS
jgi:hypothetical protein